MGKRVQLVPAHPVSVSNIIDETRKRVKGLRAQEERVIGAAWRFREAEEIVQRRVRCAGFEAVIARTALGI